MDQEGYRVGVMQMTDAQLLREIARNVFEGALKGAFKQDTRLEDAKCRILHEWCVAQNNVNLYQQGWENGTKGIRP